MKNLKSGLFLLALVSTIVPAWAQAGTCSKTAELCAHEMAEHFKQRGWVGINMDIDEETGTVTVTNVVRDSPAEQAGFREGDVLRALNGVAYTSDNEEALMKEHQSFRPGGTAVFSVQRDGRTLDIEVRLTAIPDAILTQWIGQHILEYHPAQAEVEASEENSGGDR